MTFNLNIPQGYPSPWVPGAGFGPDSPLEQGPNLLRFPSYLFLSLVAKGEVSGLLGVRKPRQHPYQDTITRGWFVYSPIFGPHLTVLKSYSRVCTQE